MHPKALLEATADLVGLVLKFDHPADQVVSRFFRDHREFGPRERATLAETVYTVLRKKLLFDHLSPSGSGSKERRMAILGFHGPRDFLKSALNDTEKRWLDNCDAVKPDDLLERHRHNLPEWLVTPLKAQLGDGFWPLVESLQQPAPLDLRVNALTDKRAEVKAELAKAAIKSEVTPFSPWGLRIEGKPALTKLDAFARGAVEVQDEGSQLLALLLDAKRGEMVVDFCAGAGGKTLAIGATMRNTGRLYAFDTSAHRLDALKPRLARSKLSNVHPAAIAHERGRPGQAPGRQDRSCAGRRALFGPRDAAAQPRPEMAPVAQVGGGTDGQADGDPAKRGPAREVGRTAGLRHLQRAAGGKRGDCRGFWRRQPRFRAPGRCRTAPGAQSGGFRGALRRRRGRQALSAPLAASPFDRRFLRRRVEPQIEAGLQTRVNQRFS
jgi:hypothetical protein